MDAVSHDNFDPVGRNAQPKEQIGHGIVRPDFGGQTVQRIVPFDTLTQGSAEFYQDGHLAHHYPFEQRP
jgi:hypothetical protein